MNRDPGAARERSLLAWRRTALSIAINGILLMHASDPTIRIAGLLVVASAGAIAAVSAKTFSDPETHGWFAGGRRRAELLVVLATVIAGLDLAAVTR